MVRAGSDQKTDADFESPAEPDPERIPLRRRLTGWRPSRNLRWLVGVYVIWKVIVHLLNTCGPPLFHGVHPAARLAHPQWLQFTAFWDGGWYSMIALDGYGADPRAPAFFPLFPLLLRILTWFGLSVTGASLVLNTVLGFAALWCLFQLAKDRFGGDDVRARYVVLLFLAFPTSYFLAMMYSEALFCALAFGAVLAATRNRFLVANILVGLATAVRGPAVLVGMLVALLYLQQRGWSWRSVGRLDRKVATFALAPSGALAFLAYQRWRFGTAFETFNALKREPGWQRGHIDLNVVGTAWRFGRYLWYQVTQQPDHWQINSFQTFALAWAPWMLAAGLLAFGVAKRSLSFPLASFVAASLLLIGMNGNFLSADRYVLPLFPLYFVAVESFRSRAGLLRAWLATSAAGAAMMLLLFSTRGWTG